MTWCARTVAALPGAVVRTPAFSVLAFALIIFGALWLCIWRGVWRFWGLSAIVFGIYLAPLHGRPDVLVAESGRLVAVRDENGRFAVAPGHRQVFELTRWLEYDGDPRSVAEAGEGKAFRCDSIGCVIRYRKFYIALSKSPASLADDCSRSHLLILSYPKPTSCEPAGQAIDFWQLRDGGAHAITIDKAGLLAMITVADMRGDRPWTRSRRRRLEVGEWQRRSKSSKQNDKKSTRSLDTSGKERIEVEDLPMEYR